MYRVGDVIDNKYLIKGVCSTTGGMGTIVFVTALTKTFSYEKLVLKFCRELSAEHVRRFRREARLLLAFKGNSKVVEIIDHGLDHDPPYFVMPFYDKGDLTTLHSAIAVHLPLQELVFLQMIDCVQELHVKKVFHRDIKPQNFLRDGAAIRVADLGLSLEQDSYTAFTQTGQWGGTQGFMPPEFHAGGFKDPDATSDIFMLGKSFYSLLTQRPPMFLMGDGIPDSLFHLIRRCCDQDPARRYQSLSELRQTVVAVYDLLLGRVDGVVRAKNLLAAIVTRFAQQQDYNSATVAELLTLLPSLPGNDSKSLAMDVPREFFEILAIAEFAGRVTDFLSFYRVMVESKGYGFSFAETIARNMATLFRSTAVSDADKATALELAIFSAFAMNRFAAMDLCQKMIRHVDSDSLAIVVREILLKYNVSFIAGIEPVNCAHDLIANTIRELSRKAAEG